MIKIACQPYLCRFRQRSVDQTASTYKRQQCVSDCWLPAYAAWISRPHVPFLDDPARLRHGCAGNADSYSAYGCSVAMMEAICLTSSFWRLDTARCPGTH